MKQRALAQNNNVWDTLLSILKIYYNFNFVVVVWMLLIRLHSNFLTILCDIRKLVLFI